MTTLIYCTGFETGAISTNGGGLVNTISGTVSNDSVIYRSGARSLKTSPSVGTAYIAYSIAAGVIVARIYIYIDADPSSALSNMLDIPVGLGNSCSLIYRYDADVFRVVVGGASQEGGTITPGNWYRVDLRFTVNTNPRTVDWAIDGVAQTQVSSSQTASAATQIRIGQTNTQTANVHYDDLAISTTAVDYPIGAGLVVPLRPSADGTHNAGANIMEDNAGNDIGAAASDLAWVLLDDAAWTTVASDGTDWVQQAAAASDNYCEILFEDTSATTIHGVRGLLCYESATAIANRGSTIAIDSDGTETTIWGSKATPDDMSETGALFYKSAQLPAPTGGWSQGAVNSLKMQIGYSTDANPIPYWHSLMFEVAVAAGATLVIDGAAHAHAADNVVLTQHNILAVQDAVHLQIAENVALVQHHVLVVQDAAHAHAADNVVLVPVLLVQDATHAQSADNVILVQHNVLAVQDAIHAQVADEVALTQHNILAAQDAVHAQIAENVVLAQHNILAVDGAAHAHAADNVVLTQHNILAVQDAIHLQAAGEVALTQHNILAVQDAVHAQAADNVTLVPVLIVQDAAHAQVANNLDLVQHNVLAIDGSVHLHAAENVVLATAGVLAIQDSIHAQAADEVVLTQHNILVVQDAAHAQAADNADLVQHNVLAVDSAVHVQAADNVDLVQHNVLAIAEAIHAQAADNLDLVQHNILAIDSAIHLQPAENVVLVIAGVLVIADAVHAQAADEVALTQHNVLAVADAVHAQAAGNVVLEIPAAVPTAGWWEPRRIIPELIPDEAEEFILLM